MRAGEIEEQLAARYENGVYSLAVWPAQPSFPMNVVSSDAGRRPLASAPASFAKSINRLSPGEMKPGKNIGAPRRKDRRRGGAGGKDYGRGKARPPAGASGKKSAPERKPSQPAQRRAAEAERPAHLWIYGRHAALAAIANPARVIRRILIADTALQWISEARVPRQRLASLVEARREDFDRALHEGAVHQGVAVEVEDLPRARLKEACEPDGGGRPVVVLDQITDPHNIGAIFRSAAAFGARAIIVQDRRTPPLAGALAKAAAGAVELVPCVEVVNIARALEGLKGLGYHCAGLAGEADAAISALPEDRPVALVLGAEGEGLRRLVAETCDRHYRIPISRRMESLNVSNAAAIALYEIGRSWERKP